MDLLPILIERAEFDPFSSIDGYPSTVSASLTDDGSEQERAAKPNLSMDVPTVPLCLLRKFRPIGMSISACSVLISTGVLYAAVI